MGACDGPGELFELFQCGARIAALPVCELGKASYQGRGIDPRALARPLQQLRFDVYPHG
jgi:hypothetical protein